MKTPRKLESRIIAGKKMQKMNRAIKTVPSKLISCPNSSKNGNTKSGIISGVIRKLLRIELPK